MTFEELAKTLGIRNKTLRMAFSRHKLSIRKPADIQSFLTQRFGGKRRHRAARPQQTGKHLEKWRFVKKTKVEATPPPTEKITRDTEMEARIKTSEEEAISLQTKISTTETKLQEKEARIQQLEAEKVKLEETNTSLEKTNQALKMQLAAVKSISQAQGKIIESLKKNKSEEAKTSVEKEEAKIVENPPCHSRDSLCHSCEGRNPEKQKEVEVGETPATQTEAKPTEETPKAIPVEEKSTAANQESLAEANVETPEEIPTATETPAAAEVFSEIPDESNPEKEKQIEVEAAETAEKPAETTASKTEENPVMETETTEKKVEEESPAVETENAVEAEAAETNPENVETPAEIPAEEKVEVETPAEAQSEVVESPAEVAQ